MTKLAIVADLHARGRDLDAFRAQWNQCIGRAIELGCGELVVCGDVFDRETILDRYAKTGETIRAVKEPMLRFVRSLPPRPDGGPVVHVVAGNHDRSGHGVGDALTCLDGTEGVDVYRKPGPMRVGVSQRMYALPWLYDGRSPMDVLSTVPDPRYVIVFGHCQVLGAKLNAYATAKEGAFTLDPVEFAGLGFAAGFFGDIHGEHDYKEERLYIPGALRHMTFADEGNRPGFMTYNLLTGGVERHDLDAAPTYSTIESRVVVDSDLAIHNATGLAGLDNRVRLIIDEALISGAQIQQLEARGVKVEIVRDHRERVSRIGDGELPTIMTDLCEAFRTWARAQEPPIDGAVMTRCLDILKETDHAKASEAN